MRVVIFHDTQRSRAGCGHEHVAGQPSRDRGLVVADVGRGAEEEQRRLGDGGQVTGPAGLSREEGARPRIIAQVAEHHHGKARETGVRVTGPTLQRQPQSGETGGPEGTLPHGEFQRSPQVSVVILGSRTCAQGPRRRGAVDGSTGTRSRSDRVAVLVPRTASRAVVRHQAIQSGVDVDEIRLRGVLERPRLVHFTGASSPVGCSGVNGRAETRRGTRRDSVPSVFFTITAFAPLVG